MYLLLNSSQHVSSNSTPIPSSNFAQKGIYPSVFSVVSSCMNHWVIDSGATNHIPAVLHFFLVIFLISEAKRLG